jgi:ATP-dependent Clp protease protease subunit
MFSSESEQYSISAIKDDIFRRLIKDRSIFIYGEIDTEMATRIVAAILFLDMQNSTKDITMYLNCPGAEISSFFSIYDVMQSIESPIKTICLGEACSGGAALLVSGCPGKRLAYPHSQIMIHNIQGSELSGSKTEIEEEVKRMEVLNERFIEILARHTGNVLSKVKKDCEKDYYLTAEEAYNYGIVDEIIKPIKNIPKLRTSGKRKYTRRK